jgi:Methyltransferase domain
MTSVLKNLVEYVIGKIPFIGKWRSAFLKHPTPGHYYSPIPDIPFIKKNEFLVFKVDKEVAEINMNDLVQLSMLKNIASSMADYPYKKKIEPQKYRFRESENIYYTYHDAAFLFSYLLKHKPNKIIEIGSGFSSALMMDVNEFFLEGVMELIFIEPFPEERFNGLLKKGDHSVSLVKELIQNVKLDLFKVLQEGDILFIDSSHVSKTFSDLNYIMFEILPILNRGVIVHFHDVHYPFEYPKEWIYRGYSWNESYMLRGFLMYNNAFEIVYMNSYLSQKYPNEYLDVFKSRLEIDKAGAIWLVRN